MTTRPLRRLFHAPILLLVACASTDGQIPNGNGGTGTGGTGGASGTGGSFTGGTGGVSGASVTGGSSNAGASATGGASTGGASGAGNPAGMGGSASGAGGSAGSAIGGSAGSGGGGSSTTSICTTAPENGNATLMCPAGSVITSIDFASYGTPSGECGAFATIDTCHASQSESVVRAACLGQTSCTVQATNATFGGDPCSFVEKTLSIQATCTAGAGGGGSGGTSGMGGASGAGMGGTSDAGMAGAGAGGAGMGGSGGAGDCPVGIEGWATVNANGVNGTTGGGNATPVTVTTFAELSAAVQGSTPRVIVISGTIRTTDGGGSALRVGSNKTLLGADRNATIYGGIEMNGVSNVIVRNLNLHGIWPNSGPDDTIASRNSHHVLYDHLNVWDAGDGMLDITNQSDYQTVSWSKFWYTDPSHPHRLASLNGSGGGDHPEDEGYLRVTYHHNWWAELVDQRMPRVMYGDGHQYNNYFNSPGNLYCIGVGSYGSVLIENNYFKDVRDPHIFMYALWSHATARGNVYDNTTGSRANGYGGESGDYQPAPFTNPPYDYALDPAANIPDLVTRCAGPR